MSRVFADASYWIALVNRDDELHSAAIEAQTRIKNSIVYTTDEVLGEVLNFFSKKGEFWRGTASILVEDVRRDPRVIVDEQSRKTFDNGLTLYKARQDKRYSLVDCVSFQAMRYHGITEALTNDRDFEQEQFVAILRVPAA